MGNSDIANNLDGIRREPYNGYDPNMTYADVTGSSVHADGEIYAATMWELLGLWELAGQTENDLYNVMIEGLNHTPPQPAFEHMRNGMIAAALTMEQECLVWEAFAARGIGFGAIGQFSQRGPFRYRVDITESFTVPSFCQNPVTDIAITSVSAPGSVVQEDAIVSVSVTVENVGNQDVNADIIVTLFDDNATPSNTGDDQTIGMKTIASGLAAGASTPLTFDWATTTSTTLGPHTLTARHNTVADDDSTNNSGSTVVTVDAPSTGGIELMATGYKVKGLQKVDLDWTTSINVAVYRDGDIIATVTAAAYTDNINQRGGGSYTNKVCEAGSTSICSPEVTVTF